MTRLLTIALMLVMGIAVQAQKKVLIGIGDGERIYIYPSTIQRTGKYRKVWTEVQYASPQYHSYTKKYFTRGSMQVLIDCAGMKSAFIVVKYHNGNEEDSMSRTEWEAERDLEPQSPGSIGWFIVEETCKRYKNR